MLGPGQRPSPHSQSPFNIPSYLLASYPSNEAPTAEFFTTPLPCWKFRLSTHAGSLLHCLLNANQRTNLALTLLLPSDGNIKPARVAIIAKTTSISINEKYRNLILLDGAGQTIVISNLKFFITIVQFIFSNMIFQEKFNPLAGF
jgi:hypothetical protein